MAKRRLHLTAGILGVSAMLASITYLTIPRQGVTEVYEGDIEVEAPRGAEELSRQMRLDARMLVNVLDELDELERRMLEMNEVFQVSENENQGIYTVEQEREIARAYAHYLVLRRALFHVAFRWKDYAALEAGARQDQAFLLAYASGLTLYRSAVLFVSLFKDQPNAREKLNEADPLLGLPANTLDEIYVNITSPDNVALAQGGIEEFEERKARLLQTQLVRSEGLQDLPARLERYEKDLIEAHDRLAEGRRDIAWTHIKRKVEAPAYQAQSFVSGLIGHIRSPLHDEGLQPAAIQETIVPRLAPGDIVLTRRDGYLSNTFLPGNWGHAAMYLGSAEAIRELGADEELEQLLKAYEEGVDHHDGEPLRAVEAIGEGVRLSSAEFALHANTVAVLRPRLPREVKLLAIKRAMKLVGTPYDFSFDLGSQDKIICTELVYRAYAPHLETTLEAVMGRRTLKPDGLLRALDPSGGDEALATLVIWGESVDGALQARDVEALMATVR